MKSEFSRHDSRGRLTYHTTPNSAEYVPETAEGEYKSEGNGLRMYSDIKRNGEKIKVECHNEGCSEMIERYHSTINQSEHNFHSHECYLDWYRGSNTYHWDGGQDDYYGPTWQEQRDEAYERDDRRCQHCGINEQDHISKYGVSPHVHHIVPHHYFDDTEVANDSSNLVTLCATCHSKHERWADHVAESQGFK